MDKKNIRELLVRLAAGAATVDEVMEELREEPFRDLGFAKIDSHRSLRQGIAEVIYGAKTMLDGGQKTVLITRMGAEAARAVALSVPLAYHEIGRVGIAGEMPEPDGRGTIVVATGGTRLYDVGVAGLHRLLAHTDDIMGASAIVAIAGMEGALASVIGGLADCPVIAVPTSVGYGASFGGLSALLSMLNSCASGVSVVNIDNGFGAGYLASMINHIGVK